MRFTQQCMKWIIFLVIFKLQHWFILLGEGGEAVHWLRKRCPQSHSLHIPGLLHWDLIGCWSYPTGIDSKAGGAISHVRAKLGLCPRSFKMICMFVALNNSWCARGRKSSSTDTWITVQQYSQCDFAEECVSYTTPSEPLRTLVWMHGINMSVGFLNHWEITKETTCFKFTFRLMGILAFVLFFDANRRN